MRSCFSNSQNRFGTLQAKRQHSTTAGLHVGAGLRITDPDVVSPQWQYIRPKALRRQNGGRNRSAFARWVRDQSAHALDLSTSRRKAFTESGYPCVPTADQSDLLRV